MLHLAQWHGVYGYYISTEYMPRNVEDFKLFMSQEMIFAFPPVFFYHRKGDNMYFLHNFSLISRKQDKIDFFYQFFDSSVFSKETCEAEEVRYPTEGFFHVIVVRENDPYDETVKGRASKY
jgi:hypothetical protein